ncbi:HAD-IIA family hydrolase [Amaricoccus sp.]|uniref:HAD-IIA family hydrolase n=1 Tax=Amaricoccus sp. TaxID=1872485 RepID=UPI001B4F1BFF|nr:HAD family hydrolase [Amaricoccus sp.]MBP7002945.1 HAD hydrolase-like protein [Amaricoccus sp.]
MDAPDLTPAEAFAAYESVRSRLPAPPPVAGACRAAASLDALAGQFDVFLLDAFGVLNIGETAIPGVVERLRGLRASGKRMIVLTNAASFPTGELVAKYRRLGYDFAADEVISSRDALRAALAGQAARRWGVMIPEGASLADIPGKALLPLGDDAAPYAEAEGFLLLGSGGWTLARQARLEAALARDPRPVLVGNPDIVAPREAGFTIEPGRFAHLCADRTPVVPRFYGKPFPDVYAMAFERLGQVDRSRVVMVGDSLHTDVLGARVAGVAAALVTGWGFWSGVDPGPAIRASRLAPDFLLERP